MTANKRVVAVVALLAVLAGAALYVNVRLRAPATDHAVALVPSDARAYVHVFLKPSTAQRRSLQSLLQRFPATNEDEEARTFVGDLLREFLGRFDIDVDEDAGEWLGAEAAAFLPSPGTSEKPVVLLSAEDEDEARTEVAAAVGAREGARSSEEVYRATRYTTFDSDLAIAAVSGFIVVGDVAGVRASIDSSLDGSLEDVAAYARLEDQLATHRIASVYVEDEFLPPYVAAPVAMTVSVDERSVFVDAATSSALPSERLRGYISLSLGDTHGAARVALPNEQRALSTLAVLRARVGDVVDVEGTPNGFAAAGSFPVPDISVSVEGTDVVAALGRGLEDVDAALDEYLGARVGGALSGYEAIVAVDAVGFPAGARTPLLRQVEDDLRPLLEQFLTFELGVRHREGSQLWRAVVRFSSA